MNMMAASATIQLSPAVFTAITQHAQETFPDECCGVIFALTTGDQVKRLENIQNKLHALDPQTYPRTAVIAYAMDPLELDNAIRGAEARGGKLKAFYHSHPNHEAYFSDEDKVFAMPFGEPAFPDAGQIVISIYDRAVKNIKAFAWSESQKDFIEIPIQRD